MTWWHGRAARCQCVYYSRTSRHAHATHAHPHPQPASYHRYFDLLRRLPTCPRALTRQPPLLHRSAPARSAFVRSVRPSPWFVPAERARMRSRIGPRSRRRQNVPPQRFGRRSPAAVSGRERANRGASLRRSAVFATEIAIGHTSDLESRTKSRRLIGHFFRPPRALSTLEGLDHRPRLLEAAGLGSQQ